VSLSEDQKEGLMRSVHHCLVHNTLLTPPEVRIELIAGERSVQMAPASLPA
jgi:hypothetical protein